MPALTPSRSAAVNTGVDHQHVGRVAEPVELRDAAARSSHACDVARPTTFSCIGVYAFSDYDGESIYVGQTRENFGARVGRHLTGKRTDALAYRILGPFEVAEMELYLLRDQRSSPSFNTDVDSVECSVYLHAIQNSKYHAILNEKFPPVSTVPEVPPSQ